MKRIVTLLSVALFGGALVTPSFGQAQAQDSSSPSALQQEVAHHQADAIAHHQADAVANHEADAAMHHQADAAMHHEADAAMHHQADAAMHHREVGKGLREHQ